MDSQISTSYLIALCIVVVATTLITESWAGRRRELGAARRSHRGSQKGPRSAPRHGPAAATDDWGCLLDFPMILFTLALVVRRLIYGQPLERDLFEIAITSLVIVLLVGRTFATIAGVYNRPKFWRYMCQFALIIAPSYYGMIGLTWLVTKLGTKGIGFIAKLFDVPFTFEDNGIMQTWRLLGVPALASHLVLNLLLIAAILVGTGVFSYVLRWSDEWNDAAHAPDVPRNRTALVGAGSAERRSMQMRRATFSQPHKLEIKEDGEDWEQNNEDGEWLDVEEEDEEID